jgi:ribonuclease HI
MTATPLATAVDIYTDGSCLPTNPGPGGWSAIMVMGSQSKEITGTVEHSTNQRMELTAALEALNALTRPCNVRIHTDSQYVQRGMTEWSAGWKQSGRLQRGEIRNADLWKRLLDAAARHVKVEWVWVHGQGVNEWTKRADVLSHASARANGTESIGAIKEQ